MLEHSKIADCPATPIPADERPRAAASEAVEAASGRGPGTDPNKQLAIEAGRPLHPAPASRLDQLESELTTLTGHINAATCRFLMLLEEFDRLEGYLRHGLLSSAHWLNWRCGIGLNAAREQRRVARALPNLPQTLARFRTGEISYSKVRAMTRIATPENEGVLLEVARYGTAQQLETMVARWRSAERARDHQLAGRRHAARALHYHYDEDGMLVIRATLPPEAGAVVLEALQSAMESLKDGDGPDDAASVTAHATVRHAGSADDAGCVTAATPDAFDAAGGSTTACCDVTAETRRCTPGRDRSHDGHDGTDVTAETRRGEVADAAGARADADVAAVTLAERARTSKPTVAMADVTAETSGGQTGNERFTFATSDVTAETTGSAPCRPCDSLRPDSFATATAAAAPDDRPTLGQRRADALAHLARAWLDGDAGDRPSGERFLVSVHVDADALAGNAAGRSELADGPVLPAETVRRLCCDGQMLASLDDPDGRPLNVGRRSRSIPSAIRRALRSRDRHCRFPGCTRTRWLDGHHIVHWADGGETSLENLVSLCHHHHRLVHEGGFGVHRDTDGELCFTTPAGALIPTAVPGRPLHRPLQQTLAGFAERQGLAIDTRTADCRWMGEPMDYDHVGWLLGCAAEKTDRHSADCSAHSCSD
mgnify:CR=1 FL=1|jgi:hypothetical protein